ncbi:MAG: hypothetical protein ACOY4D_01880 [Pseudomonadota bacterium]
MASRSASTDKRMRQHLALEAARIMVEEGVADYSAAKRKAAGRLGAADTRNLPGNDEIEQALVEYLRLFKSQSQSVKIKELRQTAVQAMRFLERFNPRLVGAVLNGTAAEHSAITLHVFADGAEEVGLFLMHKHIPCELTEKRLTLADGNPANYPLYRFLAANTPIEIIVFPMDGIRQAPRSPVDGRPMRRASIGVVEELIG